MFTRGVTAAGLIQAAHQDSARCSLQTDPLCSHPSLWENSQPLEEAGLLMQLENQSSVQFTTDELEHHKHLTVSQIHTHLPPLLSCIVIPKGITAHIQVSYPPVPDPFQSAGSFLKDLQEFMGQFCRGDTNPSGRVRAAPVHQDNPLI